MKTPRKLIRLIESVRKRPIKENGDDEGDYDGDDDDRAPVESVSVELDGVEITYEDKDNQWVDPDEVVGVAKQLGSESALVSEEEPNSEGYDYETSQGASIYFRCDASKFTKERLDEMGRELHTGYYDCQANSSGVDFEFMQGDR